MFSHEEQTIVDISGTNFTKVESDDGTNSERFWYVKNEFVRHSRLLLEEGRMFSSIGGQKVGNRWKSTGRVISVKEIASFVWSLRLLYMKSECMSVYSFCTYMERTVRNANVSQFFSQMRASWEKDLNADALLIGGDYNGPIKTNKQLIDAFLYSGNFHSQERYKKKFDQLLEYMDESLAYKCTYNALHCSFQMNQICRAIEGLREDNLIIKLPNHLRHMWSIN